ncbi:uncharacterized protein FYW61_018576 isoform 2-T2 [Anableps anableps]
MSLQLVLQGADTMEKVDYVHRNILPLEDKLQVKQLGVHQPQKVEGIRKTDEQQVLVIKKEVSSWRSSSLAQQNPELHHIKKEEEELWISEDGEQLTVKIVDDENLKLSELRHIQTEDSKEYEAPTSSPAKQMETEPDGEMSSNCW